MPKTLMVLGAGASHEPGLPIGNELKGRIAELLDIRFDDGGRTLQSGDVRIVEALRLHVQPNRDINPHCHAACHIAAAMPLAISIDNFLDAHRGDKKIELCGKLAIVQTILAAERRSLLYHDETTRQPFSHDQVCNSWFNSFFQLLTENCRAEDLEQRFSTLTLIVFNYDRCIEQYLYLALQTYYGMGPERAAALVKQMQIYHPYGGVGALPWYGGAQESAFGLEPQASELLKLAAGIKTFTEGTDPSSSDIVAIRNKVLRTDRLIFLGFAFHRLNLELLWDASKPPENATEARCFATAKRISKSDGELIKREIMALGKLHFSSIELGGFDMTCAQFFDEYRRGLSML